MERRKNCLECLLVAAVTLEHFLQITELLPWFLGWHRSNSASRSCSNGPKMHLESGLLPFLLRDAEQCLRRSNKRFQMPPPLDHMFNKCRRPHGDERGPAPLSFIAVVHTCVSPGRRCQTCTLAVVFCRRRCSFSCLPVKRQHPLIYVCVCACVRAHVWSVGGWLSVCRQCCRNISLVSLIPPPTTSLFLSVITGQIRHGRAAHQPLNLNPDVSRKHVFPSLF